jgi:hypothetical protein
MEVARKWFPQPEIDFVCADISFSWASERNATLTVVMHFSRVADGFDKDLEIVFRNLLAIKWEDESFGLVECPDSLPRCGFKSWTHPTLIIEESRWRQTYVDRRYAAEDPDSSTVTHYFLASLNDLLHVLAIGAPQTRWVLPKDEK